MLGRSRPKPKKILTQDSIGNKSSDIVKGETGSTSDNMAPLRIGLDAISIDPRHGHRHLIKVQMISDCIDIARLAFEATLGVCPCTSERQG